MADLRAADVGVASIRKTVVLLQGILKRAVIGRRIPSNPVAAIRKPSQHRRRFVRPLAPTTVEAIRMELLNQNRLRDAVLVSVLAYAGLRPGEARALRWGDVQDRTLLIERAAVGEVVKETKTGRARTVRMPRPLASDLTEWRLACGRPPDAAPIFTRRDGRIWNDQDWRNWRNRVFLPATKAAGLDYAVRPYDLRHSFVSLLIAEGCSIVEVARQAGHSPTMTLSTYAHVIDELEGGGKRSAEAEILEAREESVPSMYPRPPRRDLARG